MKAHRSATSRNAKQTERAPSSKLPCTIVVIILLILFVCVVAMTVCSTASQGLATLNTQDTPPSATPTDTPTPTPTPSIQQVVENSGKYDCCGIDNNVNDLEATQTNDGKILVLTKVVNLAWPQKALDVGKALIFQYMEASWTSPYQPQSVTVTVLFQGDPTGAITATLTQETERGTAWDKTDPWDYWNVYDSSRISPSIQ